MRTHALALATALKLDRGSSRHQQGFATTAKVLVVAMSVAGVGLFATASLQPSAEVRPPDAVTANPALESTRPESDPDAELREWLREPQPPTF